MKTVDQTLIFLNKRKVHNSMRDLRNSQRLKSSRSSGMEPYVVMLHDTNVTEDNAASNFRVKGDCSMDIRNVGILPHHNTASQPRRPRLVLPRYHMNPSLDLFRIGIKI
jgi:hypothetical protein